MVFRTPRKILMLPGSWPRSAYKALRQAVAISNRVKKSQWEYRNVHRSESLAGKFYRNGDSRWFAVPVAALLRG